MIDAYNSALINFNWVDESNTSDPIWSMDISSLVEDVQKQERAARQIKPFIPNGQNLSLLELYTVIIKDLDRKYQTNTPQLINEVNDQEKILAKRVWTDLKAVLPEHDEADLKNATLLFGIGKIHNFVQSLLATPSNSQAELVEEVIATPPEAPSLETLEATLIQMRALRAQFTDQLIEQMPFLKPQRDQLDRQINEITQVVESFKQPAH